MMMTRLQIQMRSLEAGGKLRKEKTRFKLQAVHRHRGAVLHLSDVAVSTNTYKENCSRASAIRFMYIWRLREK